MLGSPWCTRFSIVGVSMVIQLRLTHQFLVLHVVRMGGRFTHAVRRDGLRRFREVSAPSPVVAQAQAVVAQALR